MHVVFPYVGSKNRIKHQLAAFIPPGTSMMASPFFGGGTFELHCATSLGIRVHGADAFGPLVAFWKCLKADPPKLIRYCTKLVPRDKNAYMVLLRKMHDEAVSDWYRGAAFFDTIRTAYGGVVYGSFMMREVPVLERAISRLGVVDMSNVKVSEKSFEKFIPAHADKWMYVDPPYYYQYKYYGTKTGQALSFNHIKLHAVLQKHPCWMLSYNDCDFVRDLYKDHVIKEIKVTYSIAPATSAKELLIFSKGYFEKWQV